MKESRMNVETLSKQQLLLLLSVLEGELEARDLVIHSLRAQHRDSFVQERYGQYDLTDPFLALQRDSEVVPPQRRGPSPPGPAGAPGPLAVLKLVMAHCKRMQEKMMAQLAAAEGRHRRVIADLEEERRRHALDTAEGDDVTYMLEKERERLLQQLEFERSQVKRLEKEQQNLSGRAEEDLVQQQQLSSALAVECERASARAEQESQRVEELSRALEEQCGAAAGLRGALEAERGRAQQMEARAERQLAEFDTEREQMKVRLRKEENRCQELQEQVEKLKKELEARGGASVEAEEVKPKSAGKPAAATATAISVESQVEADGKPPAARTPPQPKQNGCPQLNKEPEGPEERPGQENGGGVENGLAGVPHSPVHLHQSLSPSSTASSSLTSSPCSSPVLAKRLAGLGASSPTYPSSYQAGVNQRFQAARHKFQIQAEQDHHQQVGVPHSPRDLSPTTTPPPPENSPAKQLARNTVTQVLSRFTSQQATAGKLPSLNSSPFGTDYRNLAASPSSPSPTGRSPGPLSPGIRSPVIPRAERGHPPPVPPKKPGLNQSPSSPVPSGRASHFPELSGSCGLTSTQEGAKELDLVVSSSS